MKRVAIAALVVVVVGGLAVVVSVPPLRNRVELLRMKADGSLLDLSWAEVLRILPPGRPHSIEDLVETGNPYLSIRNPYRKGADVEAGAEKFRASCAACHGMDAKGGTGHNAPDLTDAEFLHGGSDWALYRSIMRGAPGTAMVAWDLPEREIWELVTFIRSLASDVDSHAKQDSWQGRRTPSSVSYQELLSANDKHDAWLTHARTYDGQRYSPLDAVHRGNVQRLALRWAFQMPGRGEHIVESTPIVVDDAMFLTEPPGTVWALALDTGEPIWSYDRPPPDDVRLCCGQVNRGLAILGERVYVGTLDAHLLAVDSRSGELVWDVEVADHRAGYSITHAPMALDGKIIVGVSGGEFGIRGFIDAYDAETGERLWRFYTIPADGEPGNETWSGDSWRTGGGPAWMTGTYDPALDLLYWGTGNPSPVYRGDTRLGDNLYTNSVVALDANTGALRWHFQFTPHDEHDWDSNQVPVLVDTELDGVPRKLLLSANKNAFYYVLDRETGEFLAGRPFAKQNWADGLDANGRPIVRAESAPSYKGTQVSPGAAGATNWWSPSYSPRTHLFYLGVQERAKIFFKREEPIEYEEGEFFLGSGDRSMPGAPPAPFFVRALVPETGELAWEFALPRAYGNTVGGMLTTGGNLAFLGARQWFYALDAETGAELWRVNTGGRIDAGPITYLYGDEQRVSLAAGRMVMTFGIPD